MLPTGVGRGAEGWFVCAARGGSYDAAGVVRVRGEGWVGRPAHPAPYDAAGVVRSGDFLPLQPGLRW